MTGKAARTTTSTADTAPALTPWDQLCLQVLVWMYALGGPDGQRRVPEHVLGSMPYLRADDLTVATGVRQDILCAALSVLHRRGLVARLGGMVTITPRGRDQVMLT